MAGYVYHAGVARRCGERRPRRMRAERMMQGDIEIDAFIREQGFDLPPAARRARDILESAGLTHARKRAFASTKRLAAEAALTSSLVAVCSDECLRIDREGPGRAREAVLVSGQSCGVCGGSNNRRAAIEAARLLRRRDVHNVLIIGGCRAQQALGGRHRHLGFI
jgi:hypothetical protein